MRVLLVSLLFAACSAPAAVPPDVPTTAPVNDELALARAKWADAGVDAYEMTIRRLCFCPPEWMGPFTVTVEGGEVASTLFEGSPATVGEPPTVDGLFELLETAYTDGAASIEVTYHEDWGYPLSLYIDTDERIADEEIRYTVSELIQR